MCACAKCGGTELLQAGGAVTAPRMVTVAQSHTNSATIAPAERGQSIRVLTVGRKNDKISPDCPRDAGDCLNAGFTLNVIFILTSISTSNMIVDIITV